MKFESVVSYPMVKLFDVIVCDVEAEKIIHGCYYRQIIQCILLNNVIIENKSELPVFFWLIFKVSKEFDQTLWISFVNLPTNK